MSDTTTRRRTKRRYAHELYPHAAEWQTRPLSVEVPYLYARFVGYGLHGTGWSETDPGARGAAGRVMEYLAAARIALLADALAHGYTGDEAWAWADERVTDDMEVAYERACDVLTEEVVRSIKPYPCGPTPDNHDHYSAADARGWRHVIRVEGAEEDCPDCTEPTDEPVEPISLRRAIARHVLATDTPLDTVVIRHLLVADLLVVEHHDLDAALHVLAARKEA